jgi:hypothetical protein
LAALLRDDFLAGAGGGAATASVAFTFGAASSAAFAFVARFFGAGASSTFSLSEAFARRVDAPLAFAAFAAGSAEAFLDFLGVGRLVK